MQRPGAQVADVVAKVREARDPRDFGNFTTDPTGSIIAALANAGASGGLGAVQLPQGVIAVQQTLQVPAGVELVGWGSNNPSGRAGTLLDGAGISPAAPVVASGSDFWHHAGISRIQVRNGTGHGIHITSGMGEAAYIDRVACYANAGDGVRISGPGTPVHLGHLSVHANGGAGLRLDTQNQGHVQVLYVAGDNNGESLITVEGLDVTGSVHVVGWKAERWNSGAPGHPVVLRVLNGNGGLIDFGQGRVHVGTGVTAGTAIVRQETTSGGTVGRVKYRFSYHNAGGSDYAAGYVDTPNSVTIDLATAQRATTWQREPLKVGGIGTSFELLGALGGASLYYATAAPEAALTANPGSLCMRSDGSVYRKSSGTGNTGWVQIVAAATSKYPITERIRSTRWLYPKGGTTSTIQLAQGTPRYVPLWIPDAGTIDQIGVEVTAAGSVGALLRLGLHADDGNGFPSGAPLIDAGTVDATTIGSKTVTGLSAAVTPGLYWASATVQGAPTTAPTVRGITGALHGVVGFAAGGVALAGYIDSAATITGALATSPSVGSNSGTCPLVHVRFS